MAAAHEANLQVFIALDASHLRNDSEERKRCLALPWEAPEGFQRQDNNILEQFEGLDRCSQRQTANLAIEFPR
jgi:hypothetical protein